jgi:hypothetical protein
VACAGNDRRRRILAVDAAANYLLGLPLLVAPWQVTKMLAFPDAGNGFYPRVLGGVLTGIATALVVERRRNDGGPVGLGTGGAIAINTLGGATATVWLLSPNAKALPRRGRALLGGIGLSVLAIGALEALGEQHRWRTNPHTRERGQAHAETRSSP